MARTYKNAYDYYARIKRPWRKIRRARLQGLSYDCFLIFLPGPFEKKTNYFKTFAKPVERSLLRV